MKFSANIIWLPVYLFAKISCLRGVENAAASTLRCRAPYESKQAPRQKSFLNYVAADEFAENLGNRDAAVGVLILLNDCGKNTACCKSRAVQGMNKFDLSVGAAHSHHATACLIVARIGNRAYLFIAVH